MGEPELDTTVQPDPEQVPFSQDREQFEKFVLQLLEEDRRDELASYLEELYPADLADLLLAAGVEKGLKLLSSFDDETRGEILHELAEDERDAFLEALTAEDIAAAAREQQSDEAAELIGDLDKEKTSEVLALIPPEERILITELLSYPENTAGSIMTKEFVFVRDTDTVKQAIKTIRRVAKETDDVYTVYVLDAEGVYRGHISLKKLMLANSRSRIKKIMEEDLLPIPVDQDQEEVANFFTRYDFITAPVVDSRGFMLGRITADDIMEVMQEEASEDILRMGGVIDGDETLSTPIMESSRKRILWLCMNLVTAFIAASVVSFFQSTIEKAVVLAALMPIVAGMGGNAAGQTVAVVIRNIALGELTFSNAGRALTRELTLGILNGLAMGIITGLVVFFLQGGMDAPRKAIALGMVIASAMLFNMIVAAFAGAAIPLVLKKLRIDPAIASSIFVTTCTDVLGFFAFLGLASLAMRLYPWS